MKLWEAEMLIVRTRTWSLTTPPLIILAFWLASWNESHQKVVKKMSKSCQKLIKNFFESQVLDPFFFLSKVDLLQTTRSWVILPKFIFAGCNIVYHASSDRALRQSFRNRGSRQCHMAGMGAWWRIYSTNCA